MRNVACLSVILASIAAGSCVVAAEWFPFADVKANMLSKGFSRPDKKNALWGGYQKADKTESADVSLSQHAVIATLVCRFAAGQFQDDAAAFKTFDKLLSDSLGKGASGKDGQSLRKALRNALKRATSPTDGPNVLESFDGARMKGKLMLQKTEAAATVVQVRMELSEK